ncbi:hypothetical protein [Microcoleus sp. CAWBG24]|nr:hypothetical protein [Microcoleus sp. CAWBG24]
MAINRIPGFERVEKPDLAKYRSHLTAIPCDRICPQDTLAFLKKMRYSWA